MKKYFFYGLTLTASVLTACQFKSTPKIGDAVLYEYVIKQGDSIVYNAAQRIGDTASMIFEGTTNSEPSKQVLVERIMSMSENDTLSFDLDNNQKGFLRIYKIIAATEFAKYIEESDKKQKVFEQRLQEIKKELAVALPSYQNRQKSVVDSATMFFEQYKRGELDGKLNKLGPENTFYVVKGNSKIVPERKKWVWFHYVTISDDTKIKDSYKNQPALTNLAEFSLDEALEKSAASFEEGSIILLTAPNSRHSTVSNRHFFWIEVVKVLYL